MEQIYHGTLADSIDDARAEIAFEVRSLVDTYVDLGTNYAKAPIQFKARTQEDRLQILKTLEAHAAPDAVVSKLPDAQNPQNNCRCLSRLLTLQLNVAVSPEMLLWKRCPMQVELFALAPRKSVYIWCLFTLLSPAYKST